MGCMCRSWHTVWCSQLHHTKVVYRGIRCIKHLWLCLLCRTLPAIEDWLPGVPRVLQICKVELELSCLRLNQE